MGYFFPGLLNCGFVFQTGDTKQRPIKKERSQAKPCQSQGAAQDIPLENIVLESNVANMFHVLQRADLMERAGRGAAVLEDKCTGALARECADYPVHQATVQCQFGSRCPAPSVWDCVVLWAGDDHMSFGGGCDAVSAGHMCVANAVALEST